MLNICLEHDALYTWNECNKFGVESKFLHWKIENFLNGLPHCIRYEWPKA